MTLIALIPYKDGILSVSDSMCNYYPAKYSNVDEFESEVYTKQVRKSFVSKDGNVVVSMAGTSIDVAGMAARMVIDNAANLEEGDIKTLRDDLVSMVQHINDSYGYAWAYYKAGMLCAVNRTNGKIEPLMIMLDSDNVEIYSAKGKNFDDVGCAIGVPSNEKDALKELIKAHAPKRSDRTLEDAMAIGIMLENIYINKKLPERTMAGKAYIFQVGAPIRMEAVSKNGQTNLVVSENDSKVLYNRNFDSIRAFVAEKLKKEEKTEDTAQIKTFVRNTGEKHEHEKKLSKNSR